MKLKYEELKAFQDKKGQRRQRFSRAYKQVDRWRWRRLEGHGAVARCDGST